MGRHGENRIPAAVLEAGVAPDGGVEEPSPANGLGVLEFEIEGAVGHGQKVHGAVN